MKEDVHDLLIVGAGAAGLRAAITAKRQRPKARLLLVEAQAKAGRKLLATGNGRCNLSHQDPSPAAYHGPAAKERDALLLAHEPEEVLAFFRSLGLPVKADAVGRLYPWSEEAAAVQRALWETVEALQIPSALNTEIARLCQRNGCWELESDKKRYRAKAVILATGSAAGPQLGARDVRPWLKDLLPFRPFVPALSPLIIKERGFLRRAKGARFKGSLQLQGKGQVQGEFLWTAYGLSGIAAMDMSCRLAEQSGQFVDGHFYFDKALKGACDFLPEWEEAGLLHALEAKRKTRELWQQEHLLEGFVHSRVAKAIGASQGSQQSLRSLAALLKAYPVTFTGIRGFEQAQVAQGGVSLAVLNEELQAAPGLFLAGELLDVIGKSGGYNLYWAWLTGGMAARAALAFLA